MKLLKYFFLVLVSAALFIPGCTDDSTNEPLPVTELNPPSNVKVELFAASGTSAHIRWTASTDEGRSDFKGYAIVTDKVDTNGTVLSRADSGFVDKGISVYTVGLDPNRETRYRSAVYAVTNDNKKSQSATSIIYGGVYELTGQTIDEFSSSSSAQSGYGWDPFLFTGSQYAFSSGNADKIDLHLRKENNVLTFFSPVSKLSGARTTKLGLVGTGQTAYDKAENLDEPNLSSISVAQNNVYLLKTQDNLYVKVWVTKVEQVSGQSYSTVTFDYKIQPIKNLRVLKRH